MHAVWVEFTNAGEDWKADGLYVYADGYDATNATLIETLSLDFGCLPDRAHREGRVWLARRFDQVWSHEFTAGADAVTASYGARIRARRTSGLYGQSDARVSFRHWSGDLIAGVRLDDAVQMKVGDSYALDARGAGAFLDGLALTTTPGLVRDVYFAAPLPAASAPAKGDLVAFGGSARSPKTWRSPTSTRRATARCGSPRETTSAWRSWRLRRARSRRWRPSCRPAWRRLSQSSWPCRARRTA